jgi:hypothetical protein
MANKTNISYLSEGHEGAEKRDAFDVDRIEYAISTIGRWEHLIARSQTRVYASKVGFVDIVPIELAPEETVILCPVARNAVGVVLEVGEKGRPRKIEDGRTLEYVTVLGKRDGKIEKDDLLGILHVYPKSTIASRIRLPQGITHGVPGPLRP